MRKIEDMFEEPFDWDNILFKSKGEGIGLIFMEITEHFSLISQCESQNFHIIWSDRQIHLFSGETKIVQIWSFSLHKLKMILSPQSALLLS